MYPVISTGKRTLIERPVIVTLVIFFFFIFKTHNLIINFIFPDAEALEISLSLGQNVTNYNFERSTDKIEEMVYIIFFLVKITKNITLHRVTHV